MKLGAQSGACVCLCGFNNTAPAAHVPALEVCTDVKLCTCTTTQQCNSAVSCQMQFKNVHYSKSPDMLITDYPTLNHKLKSFHIQGLHNLKCFCATNALMGL